DAAGETRQQHTDRLGMDGFTAGKAPGDAVREGTFQKMPGAGDRSEEAPLAHRFAGACEQGRRTGNSSDIEAVVVSAPLAEAPYNAGCERGGERFWPGQIAIERVRQNVEGAAGQKHKRRTVAQRFLRDGARSAVTAKHDDDVEAFGAL